MFQATHPTTNHHYFNTNPTSENNWQGDDISHPKPDTITRVMFHNIRHLSLKGATGIEHFTHSQATLHIDIQAFSEHSLDTTKFQVKQTVCEVLRRTYPGQATIQIDSSSEPAVNQYKPGGTGILILGKHASRLDTNGKGGDPLGRWSYASFRRRHFPPVTIISAYQVCPRPTNRLGNTAYHQQDRILQQAARNMSPRQAFIEDLQGFITHLQSLGHDIILGGDFNESLQDKNSRVLRLATTNHLVDPFLHKFPHHTDFGTHEAGSRRIDLVLVTPSILPCINAIGYAPFEYATHSDHRPLILDLDTTLLFGSSASTPPPKERRVLRSNDKVAVRKYVTILYDKLQIPVVLDLHRKIDLDTATSEEIEYLDHLLGEYSALAETKCRPRRQEYFSRQIVRQRQEVSILYRHLQAMRKQQDRSAQLLHHMSRTGVHLDLPPTQALTRKALQAAKIKLQETCRTSFETRQAELTQRIQELHGSNDKKAQKIVTAIQKVEQQRKTHRILKAIKSSDNGLSSVDRVDIPQTWPPSHEPIHSIAELEDPKTCTAWKTITDPADIEYYLLLRNRKHFGQAQGSPFTIEPLRSELDWLALSPAAADILEGKYHRQFDTPQMQQLLEACAEIQPNDQITHEITMEEFRGKMKSWRESTTTSPSGRHLGRYKALFVNVPSDHEDTQSETPHSATSLADKQAYIAKLILSILNYCLRQMYVLQRWKTVVNVMILKEPSNYRIHRLRVIHLYEADYNAMCAIKWRKLLHAADSRNLINEGQYGGRPGCEAQSLTLLEELKYDLSYLTRRSLFNFDNDAASCYDRIVAPLASLINRKYGLDRRIVATHASTLQQAQYRLKTSNGISKLSYSHCNEFPIYGTGQGSGNSPCIWLFLSSTLFDVHASQSHGVQFFSPNGTMSLRLSMVGFVDDATGSCNDFLPNTQATLARLFEYMRHDAQLWNDLLYCSGGKLELAKCSFHLLHFDFLPNGRPIPVIDQYNGKIQIRDAETNTLIPIPSKRPFEPHKTLGHYKAPATIRDDIATLRKKAERLSLLIVTSPITRHGARLAYWTIYLPSIKYTLPQSFYKQSTLDHAQSVSHSRLIAKVGFNRHTARAIIYAPTTYAGGGFIPWYLLQGEGQVANFLKHWRTNTIVSKALKLAVCWSQWQAGTSTSIFQDVFTPLPHLECRWISSVRAFLTTIQGEIRLDSTHVMEGERRYDIHIMDYAQNCGLFTQDDIVILNYCRLFLHLTTVSEMLDADGRSIIPCLFHCRREPWFNPNTYVTLQHRPSSHHIRYKWQKLCRQWFDSQGQLAISINLGHWTVSGEQLRRQRETYTIPRDPSVVFHWKYGRYHEYRQSDQHPRRYHLVGPTEWLPTARCLPTKAYEHAINMLVLEPPIRQSHPRTRNEHHVTFTDYVSTQPLWVQHLIDGVHFYLGPYEIFHHIQHQDSNTSIYLVSDGSQRDQALTYGWVFGNSKGVVYAEHSGHGYGTPTSHRAEAWGAMSVLVFFLHLHLYTRTSIADTASSPVYGFSDNAGLVTRISQRLEYSTVYPNSTLIPDWDLVEQICQTITQFAPVKIQYAWVKGHQDNDSTELPVEAQFNVRADALAGSMMSTLQTPTSLAPWLLPSERCQLVIKNRSIHGHYAQAIREAYTLPSLFKYLQDRHSWQPTTIETIDWEVFTQAARRSTLSPTQLTKLVYDKLPTRYETAKSNPHTNPQCPYCEYPETFNHILQCHNNVSTQFRQDLYDEISNYFLSKDAPDAFQSLFFATFPKWTTPDGSAIPDRLEAHRVSQGQNQIGWHLFPKGFLTIQWRHLLDRENRKYTASTATGSKEFLAGLLGIIWKAQEKLWNDYITTNSTLTPTVSIRHSAKIIEYATQIRHLYNQRNQCLASHRDRYFPDDIETFISTATLPQLKAYLHHYEPAIQHSLREASKVSTQPLIRFPGFTRRSRSKSPTKSYAKRLDLPTQTRAPPHKHSKWKSLQQATNAIRQYFAPSNPSNTHIP